MTTEALIDQIHCLEQQDQKALLMALTRDVDDDTLQEIGNLIETRRRAEEMKTGAVAGTSHEATFAKARAGLG